MRIRTTDQVELNAAASAVFVGERTQLTAFFDGDSASIDGIGPVQSGVAVKTPPLALTTTFTLRVSRGTQAACGTCHAPQPGSGHHSTHRDEGIACGSCHTGYSETLVHTSLHVNGTKDLDPRTGGTPAAAPARTPATARSNGKRARCAMTVTTSRAARP